MHYEPNTASLPSRLSCCLGIHSEHCSFFLPKAQGALSLPHHFNFPFVQLTLVLPPEAHPGFAFLMSRHTDPGKGTPRKWARLRLIPQVKRNTNSIPHTFWFWEPLKLWRTDGEAEQSSRSEHVSGSTKSYLGHLTLEKPLSGSRYSCWISGSFI